MKILLYSIYGNQDPYHLELTYGVLSAAKYLREDPSDIQIVLFSGPGDARPDLPVQNIQVTEDTLHEWHMDGTYNHAIQIFALKHALKRFNAPVVLIDGDTVFHSHPKHLFERFGPGRTLMHANEGTLREGLEWSEWKRIIQQTDGRVGGLSVQPESIMCNAGVLGVHPKDAEVMDIAVDVMRGIRDVSNIFTAVQLAASLAFSAKTEVSVCNDMVEHYWGGPRDYYRYQMTKMFGSTSGKERRDPDTSPLAPLTRQMPSKRRHRLIARAKSIPKGLDPQYAHACTAYLSAIDTKGYDTALANVWAVTALNVLTFGLRDWKQIASPADFKLFTPAHIDGQSWMQPNLRARWTAYWEGQGAAG